MSRIRTNRQKALADILRGGALASQEDVTDRLRESGFDVTQATVSRDLVQLGAVKVKRGGLVSYALPDQMADNDWAASRLERILSEWVQSVEPAGSLLVLRTPPGSAHIVGLALDQAQLPEVAGTISGDDTLFVALRDDVNPSAMAGRFLKLAGR